MKSKDMACLSVLLVFFALVRFVFAVQKPRIFVLTGMLSHLGMPFNEADLVFGRHWQ